MFSRLTGQKLVLAANALGAVIVVFIHRWQLTLLFPACVSFLSEAGVMAGHLLEDQELLQ